MTKANKSQSTFSAFWQIENNPKPTADRHLNSLKSKKVDFLFGEIDPHFSNCNFLSLGLPELPSNQYTKNLKLYCHSNTAVCDKFNRSFSGPNYFKISSIWLSKILLFKYVKNACSSEFIIWRDCVQNINYKEIFYANIDDRVIINDYRFSKFFPAKPFGGKLLYNMRKYPEFNLCASAIKLPVKILDQFIETYIECLIFADNHFQVYDEEVILTYMIDKYPDLFHVVYNPYWDKKHNRKPKK
jgi:hypothetical protein